ncbi:prepilin-type N-terminal cleavage/methylation domain-containing protein [Ruegeria arenilitoris]|uniref:prepilin-type N-terminal cleavage/methylation domain-containing protein n=1 Tax=Ruegeria arenilitoris TaxID=1173585 RepID=UPI00147C7D91|nr:prepilin-type N-terminal cleavage/methylation domain-containing protein [Ruegeria arenilitoris]
MSRRAGYSLFEVLIAFAVMTMVLSAILPHQAKFLERSSSSFRRAEAADIAYSRLSELGVSRAVSPGESSDWVEDWTLYQRIEPYSVTASDVDLAEVTVEVRNAAGGVLFQAVEIRVLE